MNELKNRGTEDILLAVVDGLKGFPEAITAVFPDAIVQTCIVGSLKKSRRSDSLCRGSGRWHYAWLQGAGSA
jgi:transposase-like protein